MSEIIKEQVNIFATTQLALCPYIEYYGRDRGIQFIKAEVLKDKNGKYKIQFLFLDPNNIAKDLEVEYRFSDYKKIKDAQFYYKKIISELLG